MRSRRFGIATLAAPYLINTALILLAKTLRVRLLGEDTLVDYWSRGERVILAFWHNRALLMPIVAPREPICVIVSAHRDGEIAARALRLWNIHVVRGSATRGGARGLLQLVRAHRNGSNLAVVPDGPKGPRYVAKPGIIHLARLTGSVIIPVSYAARWTKHLASWDRMIVPLPFSRVVVAIGKPLEVPSDLNPESIERLRQTLEAHLKELNRAAKAQLAA